VSYPYLLCRSGKGFLSVSRTKATAFWKSNCWYLRGRIVFFWSLRHCLKIGNLCVLLKRKKRRPKAAFQCIGVLFLFLSLYILSSLIPGILVQTILVIIYSHRNTRCVSVCTWSLSYSYVKSSTYSKCFVTAWVSKPVADGLLVKAFTVMVLPDEVMVAVEGKVIAVSVAGLTGNGESSSGNSNLQ